MRIVKISAVLAVGVCLMSGCGKKTETFSNVISSDVQDETAEWETGWEPETEEKEIWSAYSEKQGDVDCDLTQMSSDMVYATVYQMMVDPESYSGKTVRMEGSYYFVNYEDLGKSYSYCIVKDATACCAQGIEFVTEGENQNEGERVENLADDDEVIVEGVFETYREDGNDRLFGRLRDAVVERISESQ